MAEVLHQSTLDGVELVGRGKVRDIYRLPSGELAIVATDRISTYDVVLPTAIPGKGRTLTTLSQHWFSTLEAAQPNHLISTTLSEMPAPLCDHPELEGRTMYVRACEVLPVECIVRGYLAGSAVKEYDAQGTVCGIPLPPGLKPFSRLPEPIFTPSTKAAQGEKDENISYEQMIEIIGQERAEEVKRRSLAVYSEAAAYALERGVIIADTKFEWGTDADGRIVLIDEVLTPDSSRFWPAADFREGEGATSLDKQFVRDHLTQSGWDKQPPAPELPADVVARTTERYQTVLSMLTGEKTSA